MIFKQISTLPAPARKKPFRLLFVGLSLLCGYAQSAVPDAISQIDSSAKKAVLTEVKEMAQAQGWTTYDIQSETVLSPEASALAVCAKNPVATSTPGSKRTLYRLRYDVTCPGAQGWTITVAVKTAINLPVVIATQTLERGRVVDAQDLVLRVQDIAPLHGQFFTAPEEVTGQTVKRRITASQIVNSAQLDKPVMVERGQSVLMVARQNGIEASTTGEALKQGRKGDVIRVRNISSQRTVDALVTSPGVVQILTMVR